MKMILATAITLISVNTFAAPNCSYELKQEDYAEDASGKLTVNAITYKCKTLVLGQEGDMITVCKDKKKKKQKPEMYDFIVGFDGAEANFTVSTDLERTKTLCSGIATTKVK